MLPAAPLASFQYVRLVLEQVLNKADAVVLEDDLAAVLRGVQIDIAHDAKVVVAILVSKDLVHVPYVRGLSSDSSMENIAALRASPSVRISSCCSW